MDHKDRIVHRRQKEGRTGTHPVLAVAIQPKNDFPWGSNDRCPPLAAATTIARWGVTDQAGSFRAEGAFADGTEGNHTLIVEISGIRSNAFSFAVSKCKP